MRSTKWNANLIFACDSAELVSLCTMVTFWKTHIPVRTPKWPPRLIFAGACHRIVINYTCMVTASKLVPQLRRVITWWTCEPVSRWTLVFLSMCLDLRGCAGFFCHWILRLSSIIFNSPFEHDVIFLKRSFGFMRSLFILYVHKHDCLGFGMLTVETAVIAFVDFNSRCSCDVIIFQN